MRWTLGSSSAAASSSSTAPILPPDHPAIPSSSSSDPRRPPPACPMHSSSPASLPVPPPNPSRSAAGPAKCPVPHASSSELNPLNSIPMGLSAVDRAPGQVLDLPTEREVSTIPRPKDAAGQDEGERWEYPSPQQFYNALVRKGWETPEESIEMVVQIHNFLNERAWDEVMRWEKRLPGGEFAQLARFQGRPGELSPKARLHLWLGKLLPERFNTEPPFDRHDWVVTRPAPSALSAATTTTTAADGETVTTRYVIDYYSAPPDEEGNPVFHLDVRPALDSFESVSQRIKVGVEEWMRGENQGGD